MMIWHLVTCACFDIVASLTTLLAGMLHPNTKPSQVVKDCQRNVWQFKKNKKISPVGWISTVDKYTWGHYCTRTVDFDFFVFRVSQVGPN